ncbi:hypothetical protein CLV59_107163 [Chitinophaga dinghuensis]|uniref:Uncharacterized protein n=1 Tax=Chitinophaga dinghuensis TaxID=1539050 RepID=A0A327VS67_9BACT|nr:hypothetical protein CLV59_107163 [Chitinophaga dinghuensis]
MLFSKWPHHPLKAYKSNLVELAKTCDGPYNLWKAYPPVPEVTARRK